jgi:hypothetical protein
MTFERLECERLEELKDKENDIGTVREGLVAIDLRVGMNLLRTPSHPFPLSHFARAAAAHLHLHLAMSPDTFPSHSCSSWTLNASTSCLNPTPMRSGTSFDDSIRRQSIRKKTLKFEEPAIDPASELQHLVPNEISRTPSAKSLSPNSQRWPLYYQAQRVHADPNEQEKQEIVFLLPQSESRCTERRQCGRAQRCWLRPVPHFE